MLMIYLLLFVYLVNLFVLRQKQLFKSAFILHFFFLTIIFLGPALYYEFGGKTYSKSFEEIDLITFEKYGVFVFFCTLVYTFLLEKVKISILRPFFSRHTRGNKNIFLLYFGFWYTLVLVYLCIYINELPVVKFLLSGSLPDRLDQSSRVKLFYSFSSFFMVFIPSGYFYFIQYVKDNLAKIGLLLLVTIILISGGHKGLVTFFIIFALVFSGLRFNLKKVVVSFFAVVVLLGIYTITKGKEFNKETFYYLLESPPRRFFVTQGSAFITRISMKRKNEYRGDIFDNYQSIKKQTFQKIYPGGRKTGAAPTFFLGDLHVKYGHVIAGVSYLVFLLIVFPFIKGLDSMENRKLYLWWNLFILFFLLGMAELSIPSLLRIALALGNFLIILIIPKLTLKLNENQSS